MSRSGIWCLAGTIPFAILAGCGGGGGGSTVATTPATSAREVLNPLTIRQFGNPLPIIPAAAPDTRSYPGSDFYTVKAEQTSGYDFGLRKQDGSEFLDPATGQPIRTTTWGYTVNGVKAGYLGASIEARSTLAGETGKPVKVNYINNLRDSAGSLLTRHLFTVDPTLDGTNQDEPEIRIATHLHGGHVPPESDGHPLAWVTNDPNAATGLAADSVSGRPARPNGNSVIFDYPNDQRATQLWFHDHALGITRINVYAGLAANYFIRDSVEDASGLPSGAYEIPLVVQDKSFNQDGSLHYSAVPLLDATGQPVLDRHGKAVLSSNPEFFGNTIVVNGKVWPYLDVEPRRYRFRMLNGSDTRFYNLWIERAGGGAIPANAIRLVGNEGGLMPNAITIADDPSRPLLMAPGEREDLVLDFSLFPPGESITVRNDAPAPYPTGDPVADLTTGRIMQFHITKPLSGADTSLVPANPRAAVRPTGWNIPAATRIYDLQEYEEENYFTYNPETGTALPRLEQKVNGRDFRDPFNGEETHPVGSIEDWIIINNTGDEHPMHIHLVNFEVIEKGSIDISKYTPSTDTTMPSVANLAADLEPDVDGAGLGQGDPGFDPAYAVGPEEQGWKETVRVPPASAEPPFRVGYVKVRAQFDIAGTYMWHCHILSHEEHEMMRPFKVTP